MACLMYLADNQFLQPPCAQRQEQSRRAQLPQYNLWEKERPMLSMRIRFKRERKIKCSVPNDPLNSSSQSRILPSLVSLTLKTLTSFRPIVSCTALTKHEVIRSEQATQRTRSNGVHRSRLKIDQNGTGNILVGADLIVIHRDAL